MGANFEVRFDDMTRGYILYFMDEGIIRNNFCYALGFDSAYIILKTSNIPQSDKTPEDSNFNYYIINKTEYINFYAEPYNSGIKGPFRKNAFYTIKNENEKTVNLKFNHDFNKEPIITFLERVSIR